MEPTKDQDQASKTPAAEDDVIDLTDILEEGASETVIEISSKMDELDSLDLKSLLSQEVEAEKPPEPADAVPEKKEESLEDLLYSLKEEPEEPAAAPAPEMAFEPIPEPPEPVPLPEVEVPAPAPAAALPEVEVQQQVQASLSEERTLAIVQEMVRETVERICRELFPSVASQVVDQEIAALKRRLEEEET
ncbi:MAG: hypothetical protein ACYDIC_06145 [Desulfobaccales bacterium]